MSQSILHSIVRHFFPKRSFASGTAECSRPEDLFPAMLAKLTSEKRWEWVTFEAAGTEGWVQVAFSDREFALNLAYPFDDDPIKRLARQGIDIPQHWDLVFVETQKAITFTGPEKDLREFAAMVHAIFQKLFGCLPNYTVTAYLE